MGSYQKMCINLPSDFDLAAMNWTKFPISNHSDSGWTNSKAVPPPLFCLNYECTQLTALVVVALFHASGAYFWLWSAYQEDKIQIENACSSR